MLIAKVVGNVWSTKKYDSITALRLLFVQPLTEKQVPMGGVIVAADEIGAGKGELVLVTQGTPASTALDGMTGGDPPRPIDAVVVGIVDSLEIAED